MKPYQLLMIEHRLIERLFPIMRSEISLINTKGIVRREFIDVLTDFFITYIDIAHHGKEENILFNELLKRRLLPEHKQMIKLLLEEHNAGRTMIRNLVASSNSYFNGNKMEADNIIIIFEDLINLYSKHIKREDKEFYSPTMSYFTAEEQDDLLQKFYMLNIKLIDEKYSKIFDLMEGKQI